MKHNIQKLILTLALFVAHVESLEAERVTEESYIFLLAETILRVHQRQEPYSEAFHLLIVQNTHLL